MGAGALDHPEISSMKEWNDPEMRAQEKAFLIYARGRICVTYRDCHVA